MTLYALIFMIGFGEQPLRADPEPLFLMRGNCEVERERREIEARVHQDLAPGGVRFAAACVERRFK